MKARYFLFIALIASLLVLPVSADTHYPMDDGIFVELNGMSSDWVFYEHFVWEDLSLLNHWNLPTYVPSLENQTPAGVWNVTISFEVLNYSGQYWYYMACESNDALTIDFQNDGAGESYADTGPFNITIDTNYWGDGWMRFNLHCIVDEPWLVENERWLTNWFYINNTLEAPAMPTQTITEELQVQFIQIPFTAAFIALIVLIIKRLGM